MPEIVVIGAGVIGLSAALNLQRSGHQVTIIARDFPQPFETTALDPKSHINYTSFWAGAHLRYIVPSNAQEMREHNLALVTYRHMQDTVHKHPDAGITFMRGIEYLANPSKVYQELTLERAQELGMEGFKFVKEGVPEGTKFACEYTAWCLNPMMYCAFLLRQFSFLGGKIMKRDLRSPSEVFVMKEFPSVPIVVNASGTGFGDPAVFLIRGQTCLVANEAPDNITITRQLADDSWSFSIPRGFGGGTVIGGTKEIGDLSPDPSEETRAELLRNFDATYPALAASKGGFKVLRDIVGRRPAREGGLRLETEKVGEKWYVVHSYGLGGRGFELSWGVAEKVRELVEEVGSLLTRPKL